MLLKDRQEGKCTPRLREAKRAVLLRIGVI